MTAPTTESAAQNTVRGRRFQRGCSKTNSGMSHNAIANRKVNV